MRIKKPRTCQWTKKSKTCHSVTTSMDKLKILQIFMCYKNFIHSSEAEHLRAKIISARNDARINLQNSFMVNK